MDCIGYIVCTTYGIGIHALFVQAVVACSATATALRVCASVLSFLYNLFCLYTAIISVVFGTAIPTSLYSFGLCFVHNPPIDATRIIT